ncbi:MAG: CinA family nicotinamide mononucleotide deamidase-related protein [Myxococcota bacterium]
MRIEVVAVGSELLNGDLADAHTARFGALLRGLGLGIQWGQTVPDDLEILTTALATASARADLVLVTGGLGSTEDDLTMDAASAMTGRPLVQDDETLARIQRRYEARARPFLPALAKQALIPTGALALSNAAGSAPAVRLTHEDATFFFFPGVPSELEHLVAVHLQPWLDAHPAARPRHSRTFKTFGKTESGIAHMLADLPPDPRVTVAYRASFPRIQVTLHIEEPDPDAAGVLLTHQSDAVRERLAALVYSESHDIDFPHAVVHALLSHDGNPSVAVAESCTGGLITKLLTDVPGASACFKQGWVTYSNEAKSELLGVPLALIEAHGAVSEPVARAMAEGARDRADATIGLATTGIAGPGGGSPSKPVGTVHIAMATPTGTQHRHLALSFNRARNRTLSAWATLDMLRRWTLQL